MVRANRSRSSSVAIATSSSLRVWFLSVCTALAHMRQSTTLSTSCASLCCSGIPQLPFIHFMWPHVMKKSSMGVHPVVAAGSLVTRTTIG